MDEAARARLTEIMATLHTPDAAGLSRDQVRARVLRDDGLYQEMREIQDQLRADFARSQRWIVAQTPFEFDELAAGRRNVESISRHGLIDHADTFREPGRPFRPVALLTHSYTRDRSQFEELSRETGLPVEFLDWSWYYPEHCTAALFRRI